MHEDQSIKALVAQLADQSAALRSIESRIEIILQERRDSDEILRRLHLIAENTRRELHALDGKMKNVEATLKEISETAKK